MKQTHKTSFVTIIVEVVSIILAVIIGFIVNEWREDRSNNVNAESALNRITTEIKQNLLQLQSKQIYYQKMDSVFESLVLANAEFVFDIEAIPGWRGLNPPTLSTSAFETATTIGIFSLIDFETADHITKIYLLQNALQQLNTNTLNSLISGNMYDYKSFAMYFTLHVEMIDGLLNSYNHILATNLKNYVNQMDIDS